MGCCYERFCLSFLEVILNFLKDLLKGYLQGSYLKVFQGRTLEVSACPLWAYVYSMSFIKVCKGQSGG